MSRLAAFGRFWWEFVVGDDWIASAGIVASIGVTAALSQTSVGAWWVLPVAVVAILAHSLRRATRHDLRS